jgi:hypothetical protein
MIMGIFGIMAFNVIRVHYNYSKIFVEKIVYHPKEKEFAFGRRTFLGTPWTEKVKVGAL